MRRPPSSSLAAAWTVAGRLLHAQGSSRWRRHPPRAEQLAEAGFAAQLAVPASSTRSVGRGRMHQRATTLTAPGQAPRPRPRAAGRPLRSWRRRASAHGGGRTRSRRGGGGRPADGWRRLIGPLPGRGGGRVGAAHRPLPGGGRWVADGRVGGLVGLDGLNRLGLESGVIWSF